MKAFVSDLARSINLMNHRFMRCNGPVSLYRVDMSLYDHDRIKSN